MSWNEWIRGAEVEPSLYGADFSRLGEQVGALLSAGCRVFHFDVGDGHFVEPVTMGPIVLQWIAPVVHEGCGVLDVHLMVDTPAKYFEPFKKAGADSVTFHYEAVEDVPATIRAARDQGLQVGVAFNPETEPEDVSAVVAEADFVLCMSIHPGYSGQKFRDETYERIDRLVRALPPHLYIQVDGGVGLDNIRRLHDRGVKLLVAASSIFSHDDPPSAYRELAEALA